MDKNFSLRQIPHNDSGPSVYSLGATDGFWIGLIMGLCAVCIILCVQYPFLSLPGLALFICTPFFAWMFLKRRWIEGEVPPSFSAVWLHGICIFLFGGLILALIMYVMLRFVTPNWIESQTLLTAQRLADDPETARQASTLYRIAESGQLPSAIYTAVSSIWLVAFTGSLWSMIFALILTRTRHFINRRLDNID